MINHARTLLLNASGSDGFIGRVGEEIVPAMFQPVDLNDSLNRIRDVLFGPTADKFAMDYRVRQYMELLHTQELEDFVLSLDSRITYDLKDNPYMSNDNFQPVVTRVAGSNTTLQILGDPLAERSTSFMRRVWQIHVVDGTTCDVTTIVPGTSQVTETYSISSGLSTAMNIPNSGLSFKIVSSVGTIWQIELLSRPLYDIGVLLAGLDAVGAEALAALFRRTSPVGRTEPMLSFYNAFETYPDTPHRLGAALLALIYDTEELRIPQ